MDKKIKDICKFYDKYGFFPDEKKKGIRMLTDYIKSIRDSIKYYRDNDKETVKLTTERTRNLKNRIKDRQKLKEKLQNDLKKK